MLYDTADLVSRFRRLIKRPDETAISTEEVYRYLTDAQLYWLGQFVVHFPRMVWDTWEKMTPSADNTSYTFEGTPLGRVEIFSSTRTPYRLRPGSPWDHGSDFFWDGQKTIRIPGGQPRIFADGPYARYVPAPEPLGVGVDPVLQPENARLLIVYSAAAQWAHEGGLENPAVYEDLIDGLWLGKRPGDTGLLGQLKQQYAGSAHGSSPPWYKNVDMSNLPIPTR